MALHLYSASLRAAQPSRATATAQKVNIRQEMKAVRAAVAAVLSFVLALSAGLAKGQSVPVVTGDARVDMLLSQMTLEEKLTLIHGTPEAPAAYQGQEGYVAEVGE